MRHFIFVLCLSMASLFSISGFAEVKSGVLAPDFKLMDSNGKEQSLSKYKGKTVVLEWLNYDCPFVRKHYDSKNMQGLQKKAKKEGVIWLSIISSAKGKQGNYTAAEINERNRKEEAVPAAILMDSDGKVGKLYGAKTTPHLFVIDTHGTLAYQGAIDDHPSTEVEDIAKSKNYVDEAIMLLKAEKKLNLSSTKPYGCSVKY